MRKEKSIGIVASGKGLRNIDPLDLPIWCPLWVVEEVRKRQKEKA